MNIWRQRILDLVKYRDLLILLVERDIKLKYRRSVLGYVWSVLNPLMIMMIMMVVFSNIFRYSIENYPVYLLTGQLCYTFLTESTNQAIGSIVGSSALLKKVAVPKYIFTLSKVSSSCVNLLFSLGALIIVMLFCRMHFYLTFLLVPLVLLQLYAFCLGLGLLLAAGNVFFRDIPYIYSAVTTAWMYMTPIFYPLDQLSAEMQWVISTFNPMYFYIEQFRQLAIYGSLPVGSIILKGIVMAFAAMAIGGALFAKTKDSFILYI